GACLSILREPRWQGEGADARRAAPPVVVTTGKPCNAADAPLLANPSGPGRFPLMRRCRLLIGSLPNGVGSALPEGKSAAVAATRNTQTGSLSGADLRPPFRVGRQALRKHQSAQVMQGTDVDATLEVHDLAHG